MQPQQVDVDLRTANQLVLTGVRFVAILLGLDSDSLLYRYIIQEAEAWLANPDHPAVHTRAALMSEGVKVPSAYLIHRSNAVVESGPAARRKPKSKRRSRNL